jgi:hypothetical protein
MTRRRWQAFTLSVLVAALLAGLSPAAVAAEDVGGTTGAEVLAAGRTEVAALVAGHGLAELNDRLAAARIRADAMATERLEGEVRRHDRYLPFAYAIAKVETRSGRTLGGELERRLNATTGSAAGSIAAYLRSLRLIDGSFLVGQVDPGLLFSRQTEISREETDPAPALCAADNTVTAGCQDPVPGPAPCHVGYWIYYAEREIGTHYMLYGWEGYASTSSMRRCSNENFHQAVVVPTIFIQIHATPEDGGCDSIGSKSASGTSTHTVGVVLKKYRVPFVQGPLGAKSRHKADYDNWHHDSWLYGCNA